MIQVSADDRIALRDLTHRYALLCDTLRNEEVHELFTDDGSFDETELSVGRFEGRERMKEFFSAGIGAVAHMIHQISNHMISEYDGHNAKGLCYVCAIVHYKNGGSITSHGYYDDVYVKEGAEWKFRSRYFKTLLPPQFDAKHLENHH